MGSDDESSDSSWNESESVSSLSTFSTLSNVSSRKRGKASRAAQKKRARVNAGQATPKLPFDSEEAVEGRIQQAAVPSGYRVAKDSVSKQDMRQVPRSKRSMNLTKWGLLACQEDDPKKLVMCPPQMDVFLIKHHAKQCWEL